jgi:hypothetical protein
MTGRSKLWLAVAGLFFFVNFAGAVLAAVQGEMLHAGTHAGLLVVGAYIARRIWRRRESEITALSRELTDGLTHLEQSVAAVGIEVERIGEGQRFITQLFTGQGTSRGAGEGAAEPPQANTRGSETQ